MDIGIIIHFLTYLKVFVIVEKEEEGTKMVE